MGEEQCYTCPCRYDDIMCAAFDEHCEFAVEQCHLTPDLQKIVYAMIAGKRVRKGRRHNASTT